MGQRPKDPARASGPSDDQADQQGPARQPECEVTAAGNGELQFAEHHAQGHAERETGDRVGRGPLLGVAQEGRHLVHATARGDDANAVADLEGEVVGGKEVDVTTSHAGCDGTESAPQSKIAEASGRRPSSWTPRFGGSRPRSDPSSARRWTDGRSAP